MLPKILILNFILLISLNAQDRQPVLIAKVDDKEKQVLLTNIQTRIQIAGRLAETSQTMTFTNETERELTGTLYFPLPEGATVSGYALDIHGQMIDGVVVSKAMGRKVFEKIVRQSVDPGLIEWARGNTFKTRVFPIPANGSRKIKVVYVSEIAPAKDSFKLPLNFKTPLKTFDLKVEVLDKSIKPRFGKGEFEDLLFKENDNIWEASVSYKNKLFAEDLEIQLPHIQERSHYVEKASDGQYYFVIYDHQTAKPVIHNPAKKITVIWDFSLSRSGKHEQELKLLKSYLTKLAPNAEVNLIKFSNTAKIIGSFTAKDAEIICQKIREQPYDGGTHFASLKHTLNDSEKSDLILLFSDGVANWGQREFTAKTPVFTFSADKTVESSYLKRLSLMSGGQWFNLKSQEIEKVVEAIGGNTYQFLSAKIDSNNSVYPKIPQMLNGTTIVTGKMDKNSKVNMIYGYSNDAQKDYKNIELSIANAFESDLIRRYWAQKKLANLLLDKDRNRQKIIALGKEYSLVTPFTSLIVLESVDQYIEHNIRPPESMPEWVKKYDLRIKNMAEVKSKLSDSLLSNWSERLAHYQKDFTYSPDFKYKTEALNAGEAPEIEEPREEERSLPAFMPEDLFEKKNKEVLSSLVILGLLAHGEGPTSRYFGDYVKSGLQYLKTEAESLVKNKKCGNSGAYILWALSETYTMTGISILEKPILDLNNILVSEFNKGHWPSKTNEVLHNLICSKAIISSYKAGVTEQEKVLLVKDHTIKWLAAQKSNLAILASSYLSQQIGEKADMEALMPVIQKKINKEFTSYLEHYLATQVCFHAGGDVWRPWKRFSQQSLDDLKKVDGTWPAIPAPLIQMNKEDALIYNSNLANLCLTVYYRFLPSSKSANSEFREAADRESGGAADSLDLLPETKDDSINNSSIEIKPWDPKKPYITSIKNSADNYKAYLKERPNFINSPSFYFDCASYFYNKGDLINGEKVLSNIIELELENAALMRVIAYRLLEAKSYDLAIKILEDVLAIREEEPQSYRDLALAISSKAEMLLLRKETEPANELFLQALNYLEEVITKPWDRFSEIEVIALSEYNRIYKKAGFTGKHFNEKLNNNLSDDIRIVLSWDADQTDIDLWVIEPSGEKVFYSHNKSTIGGRISKDFTGGYGPEEYTVRKAMKGKYKIQANFYGSQSTTLTGGVTLKVDVYTKYGTAEEKHKTFSVKLSKKQDVIDLAELDF